MANILLLTGDIGPTEGSIHNNLAKNGHRVFTYNISGRWVPREPGVPLWMQGNNLRHSPMARNWLVRSIRSKDIQTTIASGLRASAFAANNLGGDFYPLLWRGELDFNNRDKIQKNAFKDLLRTSDRLLLEDPWEMDKAVSKGSQIPHLLMRYPAPPHRSFLTSESGNVVIIYPKVNKQKAELLRQSARDALGPNVDIGLIDIRTFYTANNLAKGEDVYDRMAQRLAEYSYAIVLGSGPHHSTVVRALAGDKHRIVVDQTVGMTYLSRDLDLPHRARGVGCIQVMKHIISSADEAVSFPQRPRATMQNQDLLVTFHEQWQRKLDFDYEELPAALDHGPLNIFFSVGAVQDITQGARHQRVRNMHDEFSRWNSLNIYGSQPFLDRRLKMAEKILNQGRGAGVFYGENSTSAMPEQHVRQMANFLERFADHGGRSMWFVRDLHWLKTFDNSPWTEERTAKLISDGLNELSEIGDRADILAAPSGAAGQGFNALLTARGDREREWHPLPPAVQPQNVVDDRELLVTEGTTLLYTGGISEIYGMKLYLEALQGLDENLLLDFVVRKPEADPLNQALARLNLLDTDRTRVLHTSMDLYQSRTSRTLGMVLLDSDYAKFAFPYKTLTMLERGYPILCYSDMGIADFVESNKIGIAVERSVSGIRCGINTLLRENASGINVARKNETWERRADEVHRLLSEFNPLEHEGTPESS